MKRGYILLATLFSLALASFLAVYILRTNSYALAIKADIIRQYQAEIYLNSAEAVSVAKMSEHDFFASCLTNFKAQIDGYEMIIDIKYFSDIGRCESQSKLDGVVVMISASITHKEIKNFKKTKTILTKI